MKAPALVVLLALGPLLWGNLASTAKPEGVVQKREALRSCMQNFQTNVNEKLVKDKDGAGPGRGKVKAAKGGKYMGRKKAMSDFLTKTRQKVKYEQQAQYCSASVFDNSNANREYTETSVTACKQKYCGDDPNDWDKAPCTKPQGNGDADACVAEVQLVFGADDQDTPADCAAGDCRPACVEQVATDAGATATYSLKDYGYTEPATTTTTRRRLGQRHKNRLLLLSAMAAESDEEGADADLSSLPEVLRPVYHQLREHNRLARHMLADEDDEDDDYDDEQVNGASWTSPRTTEILDRVANRLDGKIVERFCNDVNDGDTQSGVVAMRLKDMDRKNQANTQSRRSTPETAPTLERRRQMIAKQAKEAAAARRRSTLEHATTADMEAGTTCTNNDRTVAVDRRAELEDEAELHCCRVQGSSLSDADGAVSVTCSGATGITVNVTTKDDMSTVSCTCYAATYGAPGLLFQLGARDLESIDCVSRGDGLCIDPLYAYDNPYDSGDGTPMKEYKTLLERLASDGGVMSFKLIPNQQTDPDKWYRRKVSYTDKYELVKRMRTAEYVSSGITVACAVAQSISAVVVGGFAYVAGGRFKAADVVCPVLLLVPDTLAQYWANVIMDIDNQNSVIDGTETTAMYQLLHVVGYNQEVAVDVNVKATKQAGDAVATAMDAETQRIKDAIQDMEEEVTAEIEFQNSDTRKNLTALINDAQQQMNDLLKEFNNTIRLSQDRVEASLCDAKAKASLSQRELDYQRRLLLVPQGKQPGYVNSVTQPATTLAYKECNSPYGNNYGNTHPNLNQCAQLAATSIAATNANWNCTIRIV